MKELVILNLHRNNLASLSRFFDSLGVRTKCTDDMADCESADGIIVPGVGSFRNTMDYLSKNRTKARLREAIERSRFMLGICLGMQILADHSTEGCEDGATVDGLGLIHGIVKKIPPTQGEKVPNMGWRKSVTSSSCPFSLPEYSEYFYYAHSYYFKSKNEHNIYASSEHGSVLFPTIIGQEHIVGVQFHPEISSQAGESLIKAILKHWW
jgi:glutamine amidotransferase